MVNLATNLISNSFNGASYFVTNGAANGLPDVDDRVLIMQVTTTGEINGIINYQVFPEGIGANQIIKTVEFFGAGIWGQEIESEVCGCTDINALNYNPEVTYDDGSCLYCNNSTIDSISENNACVGDLITIYGDNLCVPMGVNLQGWPIPNELIVETNSLL